MNRYNYGVTFYDTSRAYNGYTLFAPKGCKDVWLMDMQGRMVHRWTIPALPREYGRLLPNGHLVYSCKGDEEKRIRAGVPELAGRSGLVREVDWDNNLIWEYEDPFAHHDFCRMENGNTMLLRYVQVPHEIMVKIQGGLPETEDNGKMWCANFNEVTPEGKVVWEWFSYEHLDPVEDSICPLCDRREWTHGNACIVLDSGDILVSFRNINTICIVDKGTGDIKWKWGHGLGELAHPHDPHQLPNGNLLIFDNGAHRPGVDVNVSLVIELNPKTREIVWEYKGSPPSDFYSAVCSGTQRLPNGNTLICAATQGRIFEITEKGEIVWEFVSPFYGKMEQGITNWMFRAYRYGPDYEGLAGKTLAPEKLASWNGLYSSSAFRA